MEVRESKKFASFLPTIMAKKITATMTATMTGKNRIFSALTLNNTKNILPLFLICLVTFKIKFKYKPRETKVLLSLYTAPMLFFLFLSDQKNVWLYQYHQNRFLNLVFFFI